MSEKKTLNEKAVSGVFWTSISHFGAFASTLITTFVLMDLLLDVDFGLFASAQIIVGLVTIIVSVGLNSALIRQDEVSEKQDDSIFRRN